MSRRLEELHVFISRNDDGDEGVAAYLNTRTRRLEPMVAATEEKRDELLEVAQQLVSLDPSHPILLTKFSSREDVAEVSVPDDAPEGDQPA